MLRFVKTIFYFVFYKRICDKPTLRPLVCEMQSASALFTTDFMEGGIAAGEFVMRERGVRFPRATLCKVELQGTNL
jgi:hypothetical protein